MIIAPHSPLAVVVAGPNGAGKTTSAQLVLQGAFAVQEFVNADTIAAGLSAFQPQLAAIAAGRLMLHRIDELARERMDFAFETTLASRSFAPRLGRLRNSGYRTHLTFLALSSDDLAVFRVAERVRAGGHHVPDEVVRRRFRAGLANFFGLYQAALDSWQLLDNSSFALPRLVASRTGSVTPVVHDREMWEHLARLGKP